MIDVYESAVGPDERHAAVFERDDETAYFYLLDLERREANQIVEALNAYSLTNLPANAHMSVSWNSGGSVVGLFAEGELVALFDLHCEGQKGRWAAADDASLFVIQ